MLRWREGDIIHLTSRSLCGEDCDLFQMSHYVLPLRNGEPITLGSHGAFSQ